LLLYVGFILLAPVSLITAGLIAAWNRCKRQPELEAQDGRISMAETR
jgi:hypothetical protein